MYTTSRSSCSVSSRPICLHRTARARARLPAEATRFFGLLAGVRMVMKWLMLASLCGKRLMWSQPVERQRRSAKRPSRCLAKVIFRVCLHRYTSFYTQICTGLVLCVMIAILNTQCITYVYLHALNGLQI